MMRSRSYIAVPPGATIKEQIEDRGMTQREFASRMDLSEKHVSRLINGEVQLTPDVAARLEMVLGLPARFWNTLEANYRETLQKVCAENEMDEDIERSKLFPYKEMENFGWVAKAEKSQDKVIELRKFFEVAQLGILEKKRLYPGIACRQLAVTEKADLALITWAQKAKLEARTRQTDTINLKKLSESLPEIRAMTRMKPEQFCEKLTALFAQCGVALILLPHIGGSFLHGATFYDGKKIIVGMTMRGKDADRFWFSLFHEIGHILLGHIGNCEGTTEEGEAEADQFAKTTLIPEGEFMEFIEQGTFRNRKGVLEFSARIAISPGIVVGRLQKENYIPYTWLNDLKTKDKIAT